MTTINIDWIEICGDIVNAQQITHINPSALGKNCGAPYELQDAKYVVIKLSCGRSYRIRHKNEGVRELLKKLNLNFFVNGVKN